MNDYEIKQENRRDRLLAAADKADRMANAMHKAAHSAASVIPFGQPILVGHHSEGRDRRYRARFQRQYERSFELSAHAKRLRIAAASVGAAGISSDDPDAVTKLREELAKRERSQTMMREANKIVRTFYKAGVRDAQSGDLWVRYLTKMAAIGIPEGPAGKLLEADFCGRRGFADYQLTNNNGNMRRIAERIKTLATRPTDDVEHNLDGVTYREDATENRVMLLFPGKPEAATRTVLKSHGFKWSPTRSAWVRFLNGSGKYAASCVLKELGKEGH